MPKKKKINDKALKVNNAVSEDAAKAAGITLLKWKNARLSERFSGPIVSGVPLDAYYVANVGAEPVVISQPFQINDKIHYLRYSIEKQEWEETFRDVPRENRCEKEVILSAC